MIWRRFRRGMYLTVPLVVIIGVVLGVSVVIYNTLSATLPGCQLYPENQEQTPAQFTRDGFDTTPYRMPDYQVVTLPSRDPAITVSAFYIPTEATEPAVIVVHGLNDCKRGTSALTAAGMLHSDGFNVLMIDLRDHGESTVEDSRQAVGTEEYQEVLGAWDWLVNTQGFAPERIGVYGQSFGAATAMIAAGEEPRVAAVFADSSFADINTVIDAELVRYNLPTFLNGISSTVGSALTGDDIKARSPLTAMAKFDGRPLYITHGTADTRLSVQYATDLATAYRAQGGTVEPWIVPNVDHVLAIFEYPDEYARRLTGFFREALG